MTGTPIFDPSGRKASLRVDATGALRVVDESGGGGGGGGGGAGNLTNRSGTITSGGSAQVLIPANVSRKGFAIQNLSAGDLWFNGTGAAAASQPSFRLSPGSYYESPQGGAGVAAVQIIGATTGQAFTAREW